jgi:hypothetical protein
MLLLPFLVSKPYETSVLGHTLKVMRIAFLLERGETLWEEEEATLPEVEKGYMEVNDIVPFSQTKWVKKDNILFIPVDSQKTQLSDFYFHHEAQSFDSGLIWRTFYYIQDNTKGNKNFLDEWKYPKDLSIYFDDALKIWSDINI